jgi:cytochrome c-type biogenesis protein CcmH
MTAKARPSVLLLAPAVLAVAITLVLVAMRGHDARLSEAQRVQQIAAGLHCPICKDLSAADSPAPLAQQMREQITQKVRAGESADQIRADFIAAYGDSVLMSPPGRGLFAAVYVLPTVVIAAGLVIAVMLVRRWVRRPEAEPAEDGAAPVPAADRRRELLRQLRDLDEDLAAGKLSAADHDRLAGPVERDVAAIPRRARGGSAVAAKARRDAPQRWRRRTGIVLALSGGAAAVTFLLLGAVTPRSGGGGPVPVASASADTGPIDAATRRVQENPKDVSAHLALAEAYAAGGVNQLAAVEWLAVLELDPSNAEANTALAQLAYAVGHADQAKTMLDKALAAHPKYPEALYARGLVLLVALHQPKAARKDLEAYLAVAPFGAQRTQAETMLALAGGKSR